MSSMLQRHNGAAGFSLAEVLVALAVAAMFAAVLTRTVAGMHLNGAQLRERLDLWNLTESLLDSLPPAEALRTGITTGHSGAHSWRIEVAPTTVNAVLRMTGPSGSLALVSQRTAAEANVQWNAYRIIVRVEAPSGRRHVADAIRIAQASNGKGQ
jgi:prepilin-type N-terminal cleavage/methylation domain-containing protein